MNQLSELELVALRRLVDVHAIQEVMLRYARAIDRNDGEAMMGIFWPEGVDDHGMYKGTAEGFMRRSRKNRDAILSRHHLIGPAHVLSMDGDRAKVETYTLFTAVLPADDGDGTLGHLAGRYRDLFEKRDGEWKVLRRLVIYDSVTNQDYQPAWRYYDIPPGVNRGAVEPDDPTYQSGW